jgi:hypothetical protein
LEALTLAPADVKTPFELEVDPGVVTRERRYNRLVLGISLAELVLVLVVLTAVGAVIAVVVKAGLGR